jgi:hypothetical protein
MELEAEVEVEVSQRRRLRLLRRIIRIRRAQTEALITYRKELAKKTKDKRRENRIKEVYILWGKLIIRNFELPMKYCQVLNLLHRTTAISLLFAGLHIGQLQIR